MSIWMPGVETQKYHFDVCHLDNSVSAAMMRYNLIRLAVSFLYALDARYDSHIVGDTRCLHVVGVWETQPMDEGRGQYGYRQTRNHTSQ